MELKVDNSMTKSLVALAALCIVIASLKSAAAILIPFLLSLFIAIICNPLIRWMVGVGVPRAVAVLALIVLIVLIGMTLAGVVGSSLQDFTQSMPELQQRLNNELVGASEKLAQYNIQINTNQLMQYFDPGAAMSVATNMLSGVGNVMTNLFLILLTVVFMLFEASTVPRKIHLAVKDPDMKLASIDKFLASVNSYLAIKTLVSLATGVAVGVLLSILGVKYVVLWGVLAFLLNYIPTIGSIIAAVPAVLVALVEQGPSTAGLAALVYLMVNLVMGNVVEPKVMGKGLGLSTLVVFLSLVFWGWLFGSVGMLLSVPLTMIVKIGLESSQSGSWFAVMLSSQDEQPAKEQADG